MEFRKRVQKGRDSEQKDTHWVKKWKVQATKRLYFSKIKTGTNSIKTVEKNKRDLRTHQKGTKINKGKPLDVKARKVLLLFSF